MCWHHGHRYYYRDSTGTQDEYRNNKKTKENTQKRDDTKSNLNKVGNVRAT